MDPLSSAEGNVKARLSSLLWTGGKFVKMQSHPYKIRFRRPEEVLALNSMQVHPAKNGLRQRVDVSILNFFRHL
jgi:hypothetical protein